MIKEYIKTRVGELQVEIDITKTNLVELKESAQGDVSVENISKLEELKNNLIINKAVQAELIDILQRGL